MSAVDRQLYPFSTSDGKAIPLDIIKPKSFTFLALPAEASASLPELEAGEVVVFYSTVDAVLSFTGAGFTYPLTAGTEYSDTIFLPASMLITAAAVAGTGKVISLDGAGFLRMQKIDKWAALALPFQLSRK